MVTYVHLQHFRSYTDGSFEFDPGVNIIVGSNASGKTSVIESVLVGLSGKSFKGSDKELIQADAEWARVDIGTEDTIRTVKLVVAGEKVSKEFEMSGKKYKRLPRDKTVPTVLFEPNHLLLFHGSPELRRNFLDELSSQLVPGYATTLAHYRRVLAQRNTLLKQLKIPNKDQFFVWNLRLSELAGKIVSQRHVLIERFNTQMSQLYSDISGSPTNIQFSYETKINPESYETNLLRALEQNLEKDTQVGFTSCGPHREDMKLYINNKDASEVASRGEVRTMVLALKMLEAQFVESARNERPILLFDDVFSELDGKRRQSLVAFLKPYQSLITTTDADVVVEHFTSTTRVVALT